MEAKENQEHMVFYGHLDDWDPDTHGVEYDGYCNSCHNYIQEGEEFLEMECCHIEHTACIDENTVDGTYSCSACLTALR